MEPKKMFALKNAVVKVKRCALPEDNTFYPEDFGMYVEDDGEASRNVQPLYKRIKVEKEALLGEEGKQKSLASEESSEEDDDDSEEDDDDEDGEEDDEEEEEDDDDEEEDDDEGEDEEADQQSDEETLHKPLFSRVDVNQAVHASDGSGSAGPRDGPVRQGKPLFGGLGILESSPDKPARSGTKEDVSDENCGAIEPGVWMSSLDQNSLEEERKDGEGHPSGPGGTCLESHMYKMLEELCRSSSQDEAAGGSAHVVVTRTAEDSPDPQGSIQEAGSLPANGQGPSNVDDRLDQEVTGEESYNIDGDATQQKDGKSPDEHSTGNPHEKDGNSAGNLPDDLGQQSDGHGPGHQDGSLLDCPVCRKNFPTEDDLTMHLRAEHNNGSSQESICPICNKTCENATFLKVHIRVSHSDQLPFECETCWDRFSDEKLLKEHLVIHSGDSGDLGDMNYMCEICGQGFSKESDLNTHSHDLLDESKATERKVIKMKGFFCDVCYTCFTTSPARNDHRACHGKGMMRQCRACQEYFASSEDLAAHVTSHPGMRSYYCDVCSRFFAEVEDIKLHKLLHHGGRFLLEEEGQSSSRPKEQNNHGGAFWNVMTHRCDLCNRSFKCRHSLTRHMNIHKETAFQCPTCNIEFPWRDSLIRHIRVVHTEKNQHGDRSSDARVRPKRSRYAVKRYTCSECSNRFSTKYQLINHLGKEHDQPPVICQKCGLTCVSAHHLTNHVLIHSGVKHHVCEYCGDAFQNGNALAEHISEHTWKRAHQCDECQMDFNFADELMEHKRTHPHLQAETSQGGYRCTKCNRRFFTLELVKDHLQNVHFHTTFFDRFICKEEEEDKTLQVYKVCKVNLPEYTCNICGERFPRDRALIDHILAFHGRDSGSAHHYKCDTCSKTFGTSALLANHVRTDHDSHNDNEREYKCSMCGLAFQGVDLLADHIHSVHGAEIRNRQQYKCNACDSAFYSSLMLVDHIHSVHGAASGNKQQLKCNACDLEFPSVYLLSDHAQSVHSAKSRNKQHHQCDLCSKMYKKRAMLTRHLRIDHNLPTPIQHTYTPYKCTTCSIIFPKHFLLIDHLQKAHGTDPYTCDRCNQAYSTRKLLTDHVCVDREEEVDPLECTRCRKKCVNKLHLDNHKLIHLGLKLHVCDYCGEGFQYRSRLVDHTVIHTGKKPHECDECNMGFDRAEELMRHKGTHTDMETTLIVGEACI